MNIQTAAECVVPKQIQIAGPNFGECEVAANGIVEHDVGKRIYADGSVASQDGSELGRNSRTDIACVDQRPGAINAGTLEI